jgi:hypothetical protein
MSTPHVDKTVVTREMVDTPHGQRDLIYLSNEDAPEGYRRVVAGRVSLGHYQAPPFMDFAMSPTVLRKIADLIEEGHDGQP